MLRGIMVGVQVDLAGGHQYSPGSAPCLKGSLLASHFPSAVGALKAGIPV